MLSALIRIYYNLLWRDNPVQKSPARPFSLISASNFSRLRRRRQPRWREYCGGRTSSIKIEPWPGASLVGQRSSRKVLQLQLPAHLQQRRPITEHLPVKFGASFTSKLASFTLKKNTASSPTGLQRFELWEWLIGYFRFNFPKKKPQRLFLLLFMAYRPF